MENSRILKFRAWDKKLNIMWEAISLEKLLRYFMFQIMPNAMAYKEIKDHFSDIVWLEYTGLKDKNGTELFEGDIVKSDILKNKLWQIAYRTDREFCGFLPYEIRFMDDKVYSPLSHFIDWESLIVIGNIHENPELLKP